MRLAAIFAVLDQSNLIRVEHLQAALALWKYCDYSAQKIFGSNTGNKIADKVIEALRKSTNGLSKTEIAKALSGHYNPEKLDDALSLLQKKGLAHCTTHQTTGRPAVWWYATENFSSVEGCEISELSSSDAGLISHNSQLLEADNDIFDTEVSE